MDDPWIMVTSSFAFCLTILLLQDQLMLLLLGYLTKKGISQLQIVVRIQALGLLFFFILVGHLFFIHQAQCHLVIFFLPSGAALLFQLVIRLHATGGVSQQLWLQWFSRFFPCFLNSNVFLKKGIKLVIGDTPY